jgi:type III secretion protein R
MSPVQLPDPAYIFGLVIMLGLVPFFAVLATSYTKLVIVFGLMRLALGTQQVPPNMVMNAMAIVLTVFIMAPVGNEIARVVQKELGGTQQRFDDLVRAAKASAEPLRAFLDRNTREREKRLFMKAAVDLWPKSESSAARSNDLLILIPSFTLSEITLAFQIGFLLYLVFTVIDLLVSAVLLAMGMSMVSPMTVSIPFKLLLFVALDGWSRLINGLMLTYR